MIKLGDDMLEWRATYHIDQDKAARLCNVSVRTWRSWERDRRRPRDDNYVAVRWVISQPPPWWGAGV
jgi:DNA-binding transcriptional regulator YiaG